MHNLTAADSNGGSGTIRWQPSAMSLHPTYDWKVWTKCPTRSVSTLGRQAMCVTILCWIQTTFATTNGDFSSTVILVNPFSSLCKSLCLENIWSMLQQSNSMKLMNISTVRWNQTTGGGMNGMIVEFRHTYYDFEPFNSYGGRLDHWSSLYLTVQTSHILQTLQVTRRNGLYISDLQTSTWELDQSLQTLQASLLPFFQLLRNITLLGKGKPLP